MTVDEYEALRLLDGEGLMQEACAARMNIARTTVTAIYESARKKVADALVHGKRLLITGGCCEFKPVEIQTTRLDTIRIVQTLKCRFNSATFISIYNLYSFRNSCNSSIYSYPAVLSNI